MPQTYDQKDCILELREELAAAQDALAAEIAAHTKTAQSLIWYQQRLEMLQREKETRKRKKGVK
jgi:hypothetical protein